MDIRGRVRGTGAWPIAAWRDTTCLALVGPHALARRYERGWDIAAPAILNEWRLLAAAAFALTTAEDPWTLPMPDGGRWAGEVIRIEREGRQAQCSLRVQTYLH